MVVVVVGIRQRSTGFPKHARPAAAMKRAEYVSIRADEAQVVLGRALNKQFMDAVSPFGLASPWIR